MTSYKSAFPSKYLKAEDLGKLRPIITITHVEMTDLGSGTDRKKKLVVSYDHDQIAFAGAPSTRECSVVLEAMRHKQWVVNKVNAEVIEEIAGTDDIDTWPGHQVELFATKTDYQGKRVPCIRCSERSPIASITKPLTTMPKPSKKTAAKASPPPDEELDSAAPSDDEDIPF